MISAFFMTLGCKIDFLYYKKSFSTSNKHRHYPFKVKDMLSKQIYSLVYFRLANGIYRTKISPNFCPGFVKIFKLDIGQFNYLAIDILS